MTNTTNSNGIFERLGELLKPDTALLQHLESKAIAAHRNVSFDPELRGEQMINEYSEELTNDLQELKDGGANDESVSDYKARYERYFTSYLHAKSNTFSVMITGGGNFPVRRHEKANRSRERHYDIFREWRQRAKKAIIRKAQPEKTYNSELDRYRAELAGMQANHLKMKEGNKIIAKAKKSGENISQLLIDTYGIAPHMVDWAMKFGFGLTNNNANMKRVEQMIKTLEQKEAMKEESPITKYLFDGGEFLVNYEVDRIQIMFDVKPNREELAAWKAKGLNTYNWSPTANAWQRKITPNALGHIKRMFDRITKA